MFVIKCYVNIILNVKSKKSFIGYQIKQTIQRKKKNI